MIEAIVALMLALTGCDAAPKAKYCRHLVTAPVLAELVVDVFQDDAVLATRIINRESGFHADAVSPVGSIGYMGINPRGVATFVCRDLDFVNSPRQHLECGKRIIAHYRKRCATHDARRWLTLYTGYPYCHESPYSRKVLGLSPLQPKQLQARRWSRRCRQSSRLQNCAVPTKSVPVTVHFPFEVRQPCLGTPSPLAELRPIP